MVAKQQPLHKVRNESPLPSPYFPPLSPPSKYTFPVTGVKVGVVRAHTAVLGRAGAEWEENAHPSNRAERMH